MGYVYVIKGYMKNDTNRVMYYIGSTWRPLMERIDEHMRETCKFTRKLARKTLVWYCELPKENARSVEFYLKKNRLTMKSLIGLTKCEKREENFDKWCKEHGIHIRVVCRV